VLGIALVLAGCGEAAVKPVASSHVVIRSTPSATISPTPQPQTAPASPATVGLSSCVRVPILTYHYIRAYNNPNDQLGIGLSVSPTEFKAQMDWLKTAGGHPVTLAQVMAAINGGPALPSHPVVLTFDDGYADFATAAAPVLVADGFVGTDFVVSGFMGRPRYMSEAQVQQVSAEGMVIGAHTETHVELTAVSLATAWEQISGSKKALEQLLGEPILDFAYPYWAYNTAIAGLVAKAGFRDAVALNSGITQCLTQKYFLARMRVVGGSTVWSFASEAGVNQPPHGWTDPNP
jgi:peptidoglycan/xylan/chitin deacetylase (PgdA/CDA1 family)